MAHIRKGHTFLFLMHVNSDANTPTEKLPGKSDYNFERREAYIHIAYFGI